MLLSSIKSKKNFEKQPLSQKSDDCQKLKVSCKNIRKSNLKFEEKIKYFI